ncbi:MAG: molybdopterin-guanine dinucleotide biosynthesis protein B [Anaerolineae bacterium]|nr:molybdopterin-guanine dinucleotide biosynthesis protein B [Anaerolineae bacterium]
MPNRPKHHRNLTVIGFYGYSNSGKTTLIERLIRDLKAEGYRVAAVKVSGHEPELDEPGKDTWRYTQAGAGVVALASKGGTAFLVDGALDMATILDVLAVTRHPDVVLVEGARTDLIRKVRLGEIEERENTFWTYDGVYEHLLQIVHQEIKKE